MFVADQVASQMHIHYDKTHRETVEVMALDELALSRLDLIKIDVESMEFEMLKGAEQTLRRHRPIIYVEDSEAEGPPGHQTRVVKLLTQEHKYECNDLASSGLPGMTSLLC